MKGGAGFRAYAVLYLLFLYAPVFLLPVFAFNDGTVIAFPLNGFTTKWFADLASNPTLRGAAWTSLIVAVATAVFSTCLAVFAARAANRYAFPFKAPMMGAIMLPMVLPDIIVAVSLLVVLLAIGLPLSSWAVILGHVLVCTPFSIAILNSSFQSLDRSLEEAALDLGETRWTTFWRVTFPLIMPGIVSSLLIAFTISLDEFIIAFFLTGTQPTLPVYIWSQLRFPTSLPSIMALGTILVALSVVLLIIAEYFRRKGLRRTGARDTGGFL